MYQEILPGFKYQPPLQGRCDGRGNIEKSYYCIVFIARAWIKLTKEKLNCLNSYEIQIRKSRRSEKYDVTLRWLRFAMASPCQGTTSNCNDCVAF